MCILKIAGLIKSAFGRPGWRCCRLRARAEKAVQVRGVYFSPECMLI